MLNWRLLTARQRMGCLLFLSTMTAGLYAYVTTRGYRSSTVIEALGAALLLVALLLNPALAQGTLRQSFAAPFPRICKWFALPKRGDRTVNQ